MYPPVGVNPLSVVRVENDRNFNPAAIPVRRACAPGVEVIVGIGVPKGTRRAEIDMLVQKSGRTTCHTEEGPITAVDATVNVGYGEGRTAVFRDQIIVGKPGFSSGGDSGSLVLDMEGYAVGKLFAGSETITIANHIQTYLDLLGADLIT